MPTVAHPQIFQLPDETASYQAAGQGTGALLAALLNLYRRQGGGGVYTSPTGATAQISPAERQLQQQLVQQAAMGQGTFQPRRLPFLGQVPISPQALPRVQLQQAQAEVAEAPLKRRKLEAETQSLEAQAEFYRRYPDILASQSGTQSESTEPVIPSSTETEQALTKTGTTPLNTLIESGTRAVGRTLRMRETQRGLTQSYKARTASLAKALDDAANISVPEREMLEQSAPQDSDSYESRLTKEDSMGQFISMKEQQLMEIANQQNPMKVVRIVNGKPQLAPDPTLQAQKLEAAKGLVKVRQAKAMYQAMFKEAASKMPPIGATPKEQTAEDPYLAEARRRGLIK